MKRMIIQTKEFKFKGTEIASVRPIIYTVNWKRYVNDSTVTLTIDRVASLDGSCHDHLQLSGKDIPKFIKELQTLVEFMKNDGLLVEDEEEGNNDDDQ